MSLQFFNVSLVRVLRAIGNSKTLWLSKEKYLFSQELDLYFNGLYFNDSIVYFSIGFAQLTAAVKLVPLHPHDREYILVKAANARIL